MFDADVRDLADLYATASSGHFGLTACRKGLAILPGRYVQPHWRQRKTVLGGYGPDEGWHLSECHPQADVNVLNSLVFGPRIRVMLNAVDRRCVGMATVDDIEAVLGIAVRLSIPSKGADAEAAAKRIVGETVGRLFRASAMPTLIFGCDPIEVWLFWKLDDPDPIRGDARRQRAYDALARRLAQAAGGDAGPAPLLTDFPMPGICCGADGTTPNVVMSGLSGNPAPTYGTRFEDLTAVAERIEAMPRGTSTA